MKLFMIGMGLVSIAFVKPTIAMADDWTSTITSIRTCKHPSNSEALIQIDFANSKSLVLANADYVPDQYKNYQTLVLTAFTTGSSVKVSGAYNYAQPYCDGGYSTHKGGAVHITLSK